MMKQWNVNESEAFKFTRGQWGERSNFAPIKNGMWLANARWTTSEALYQALKGERPNQQILIARAPTPRDAKRIGRSIAMRSDWEEIKIEAMRLTLVAKWLCETSRLRESLSRSRLPYIVEESSRDAWWGARRQGVVFVGENVLGQLLMELRSGTPAPDNLIEFPLIKHVIRRRGMTIEERPVTT